MVGMQEVEENLTQIAGRAIRWNSIGFVTRLLLSFGINVFLTRLLGPKPFGELAVAAMVFGFGVLLANVGVTAALIQKESLTDADIRFCFSCQLATGIFMTLLLFLSARFWAGFFHEDGLTAVLRVFSLMFLFQTFGTTSIALLSRKQDARTIQGISIISYLISYLLIAVPMAILGAGIWSLVAAWLSQALIGSLLAYWKVRHPIKLLLHPDHMDLLKFGFRVLAGNICSWGVLNLDNTTVGRAAGPIPLGLYSRAFTLASTPVEGVNTTMTAVLLSSLSRVQADHAKVWKVYASSCGAVLLLLAPMFAAMAAAPDAVVLGIYGAKWAGAVKLFQPLALMMPIYAMLTLSGPALSARGKPGKEFQMQLISVIIAIAAYLTAIHWSVLALSWTVLGVYLIRFGLLAYAVMREVHGRWQDLAATAWPALTLAMVAAGVARTLDLLCAHWQAVARLAVVAGGSATCIALCFLLLSKPLLRPIFVRSPSLVSLVPGRLQFLLP